MTDAEFQDGETVLFKNCIINEWEDGILAGQSENGMYLVNTGRRIEEFLPSDVMKK